MSTIIVRDLKFCTTTSGGSTHDRTQNGPDPICGSGTPVVVLSIEPNMGWIENVFMASPIQIQMLKFNIWRTIPVTVLKFCVSVFGSRTLDLTSTRWDRSDRRDTAYTKITSKYTIWGTIVVIDWKFCMTICDSSTHDWTKNRHNRRGWRDTHTKHIFIIIYLQYYSSESVEISWKLICYECA